MQVVQQTGLSRQMGYNAVQRETTVTLRQLTLYQKQQITIAEDKQISAQALYVLSSIASSTRLSNDEKQTLTKLAAIVDEFGSGDPKLMCDIMGIAKIMAMNSTETHPRKSLQEVIKEYFEEREKLRASQEVMISAETMIAVTMLEVQGYVGQ